MIAHKLKWGALGLIAAATIGGCALFAGNHDVRLVCTMPVGTLADVTVGTVSYGDVDCDGTETDYMTVSGGIDHDISTDGTPLGQVNVIGQGLPKWTVTITGSIALPALFIVQDEVAE